MFEIYAVFRVKTDIAPDTVMYHIITERWKNPD